MNRIVYVYRACGGSSLHCQLFRTGVARSLPECFRRLRNKAEAVDRNGSAAIPIQVMSNGPYSLTAQYRVGWVPNGWSGEDNSTPSRSN
jgi:hypothetical protein